MNIKNFLFAILSVMTFTTHAQSKNTQSADIKTAMTEFKINSENLEELKNFDWAMVKEIFEENDADQEITLAIAYTNKSEIDKSLIRVDNFEMTLTGKTADLDNLTARLKKSFYHLDEINGKKIND